MTDRNSNRYGEDIGICREDVDYRGIVEHINEGVLIIRDGKIVFANDAFCAMCGRPPDGVISTEFLDFVSSADREAVARYCTERLLSGNLPDRIEFTMHQDRGEAIIEMKVSLVDCAGQPAILAALTDITERRTTRFELERIKGRLESILHSMNEVVVSFSPNDGSLLAINPAAEALYGVPLREFTTGEKDLLSFVHPQDKDKVLRFYRELPEAEFGEARYRIITAGGVVKWVHDEGHVVYSASGTLRRMDHVIRDITEEKKAIDALSQSEAKYRDFFESTSDMAYTVTPDGVFMDINEAGLKLLGFESREEALATNVRQCYVDLSERAELLSEIFSKGYVEGKQVKLKNKAGEVIEVAVTARAKVDDSGNILYYDGIIHNITQTLEAQRNRVLRNAAGGLCHYLNTHLMQLDVSRRVVDSDIQSLEVLLEGLSQGSPALEIAHRMKEILEDMRYFNEAVRDAYERIAEVTKAFNKALLYKEEAYASGTILDIFKTHGYESASGE